MERSAAGGAVPAFQLNPVYAFAAAHGHCDAQSDLAASCFNRAQAVAEENPGLADEYFMAAEIFAELACQHDRPRDVALLMTDEERREEVKELFEEFRAAARDELRGRYPELASARDEALPPLPQGYQLENRHASGVSR